MDMQIDSTQAQYLINQIQNEIDESGRVMATVSELIQETQNASDDTILSNVYKLGVGLESAATTTFTTVTNVLGDIAGGLQTFGEGIEATAESFFNAVNGQ